MLTRSLVVAGLAVIALAGPAHSPAAAAEARPPASAAADARIQASGPVTIAVDAVHGRPPTGPVTYAVRLTNGSGPARDLTVTAQLPARVVIGRATGGGKVSGHQVQWRLHLQPQQTSTVRVAGRTTGFGVLIGTACVTSRSGDQLYACASETHQAGFAVRGLKRSGWWWVALGAVATVAVATMWWRRHRRHPGAPARSGTPTRGPSDVFAPADRSAAQTGASDQLAAVRTAAAVGLSALALVLPAALVLNLVAGKLNAAANAHTGTGASGPAGWQGKPLAANLGEAVHDEANDYTVYQVVCQPAGHGARCVAAVSVRNRTSAPQTWYARLQRLYTGDAAWVEPSAADTRQRNGGADVFAAALAPHGAALVQLVFAVASPASPRYLEIRTGVFHNGCRVALR